MTAYYNENNKYAAEWLRNLIDAGCIAPGVVDDRSIEDVLPSDLRGFTQCHFFAGVGVWSYALRQAGWADERPVWTGSCPCQPFSAAGKGTGFADERHLWPAFHHLIKECKAPTVFGEQVASKDAGPWIDLVQTDLETLGYAFGAVPFPSAGVGAPHIRDRAYWVANTQQHDCGSQAAPTDHGQPQALGPADWAGRCGGVLGGLGHADGDPAGRHAGSAHAAQAGHGAQGGDDHGPGDAGVGVGAELAGPTNGLWRNADWLLCRDGKWRPVEPGAFPLAHGAPARVGRLRAYGNAINSQSAKAFIESFNEYIGG